MELEVSTNDRSDLVDVTADVESAVPDDVESGVCIVFVPHTTAGVIVNESEPRLREDIQSALERLAPHGAGYAHDEIDNNADAHLRAMLLGESVTIPVNDGSLALGRWQSVLFVEGDGPRTRRVRILTVPAAAPTEA